VDRELDAAFCSDVLTRRDHVGRHSLRWERSIKRYLKEIGYWGVDWIHVASDWEYSRVVLDTIRNLEVP
jgi:hypothetical protein